MSATGGKRTLLAARWKRADPPPFIRRRRVSQPHVSGCLAVDFEFGPTLTQEAPEPRSVLSPPDTDIGASPSQEGHDEQKQAASLVAPVNCKTAEGPRNLTPGNETLHLGSFCDTERVCRRPVRNVGRGRQIRRAGQSSDAMVTVRLMSAMVRKRTLLHADASPPYNSYPRAMRPSCVTRLLLGGWLYRWVFFEFNSANLAFEVAVSTMRPQSFKETERRGMRQCYIGYRTVFVESSH
jgi:hypothetical protein